MLPSDSPKAAAFEDMRKCGIQPLVWFDLEKKGIFRRYDGRCLKTIVYEGKQIREDYETNKA